MKETAGWLLQLWIDVRGYALFIFLAVWGGTVNYLSRVNKSERKFTWAELVGEWIVSGFAGLLVALLGIEMEWSVYIVAFMAGMAGHMGGRALFVFELIFKNRLGGK